MDQSEIRIQERDGIAIIVLADGQGNNLDQPFRAGLMQALDQVLEKPGIKGLILAAEKGPFASNPDLRNADGLSVEPSLAAINRRLEQAPIPSVAVMTGLVLGAGVSLALAAHYRIAEETTRVGFPELSLAQIPEGGATQRLPRVTGLNIAAHMFFTSQTLSAPQIRRVSLADEVVAPGKGVQAAFRLLQTGVEARPVNKRRVSDAGEIKAVVEKWQSLSATQDGPKLAHRSLLEALVASTSSFAQGLVLEERLIRDLQKSPASKGLRRAAIAQHKLTAIDQTALDLKKVVLVGNTKQGRQLAADAALAGLDVSIIHQSEKAAGAVVHQIAQDCEARVAAGMLKKGKLDAALLRLHASARFVDVKDADALIMAASPAPRLIRAADALIAKDAPILLPVDYDQIGTLQIEDSLKSRMVWSGTAVGMPQTALLELRPLQSVGSDGIRTQTAALARLLRRVPIWAPKGVRPIAERLMVALWQAADHMMLRGASPTDIDAALQTYGFTELPCLTQARLGDDSMTRLRNRAQWTSHFVSAPWEVFEGLDDPTDHAAAERRAELLAKWRSVAGTGEKAVSKNIITAYCVTALQTAAAHLLEEADLRTEAIDMAAIHAAGFPRWRGGPLVSAEIEGVGRVLSRIWSFAQHDKRFWCAPEAFEKSVAQICDLDDLPQADLQETA